jgi:hypothetical protein
MPKVISPDGACRYSNSTLKASILQVRSIMALTLCPASRPTRRFSRLWIRISRVSRLRMTRTQDLPPSRTWLNPSMWTRQVGNSANLSSSHLRLTTTPWCDRKRATIWRIPDLRTINAYDFNTYCYGTCLNPRYDGSRGRSPLTKGGHGVFYATCNGLYDAGCHFGNGGGPGGPTD